MAFWAGAQDKPPGEVALALTELFDADRNDNDVRTAIGQAGSVLATYPGGPSAIGGSELWERAPEKFLLPETFGAFQPLAVATVFRFLSGSIPATQAHRLLVPYVRKLCGVIDASVAAMEAEDAKELQANWSGFLRLASMRLPPLPRPSLQSFQYAVDMYQTGVKSYMWCAKRWLLNTDLDSEKSCHDTEVAYECMAERDLLNTLHTVGNIDGYATHIPARFIRSLPVMKGHLRACRDNYSPASAKMVFRWREGESWDGLIQDLVDNGGGADGSWLADPDIVSLLSGHVKTPTFLDRVPEELRAAVAAGLGVSNTGTMGTMKC
jgi:hypothetical protein